MKLVADGATSKPGTKAFIQLRFYKFNQYKKEPNKNEIMIFCGKII